MKTVSIVGLGYIGLPTAILAAQSGYQAFGFDLDLDKIERINAGDPTIIEPELTKRLKRVLHEKTFVAFPKLRPADCFIVAVPTPLQNTISHVLKAAECIAYVLQHGNLVILESTSPVGTTAKFARVLEQISGLKLGLDFFVAYCPERVLPGKIFKELVSNDRIIGGVCDISVYKAKQFYAKFVKGKLYVTDDKTAEMVKLVENSSRDVQIAFANQLAQMCEQVGINPYRVIEFANKHPRVHILKPSCGVGGHCIAVDPWFLIKGFNNCSDLLKVSRKINNEKPYQVISTVFEKIKALQKNDVKKPNVLALGLTFKPNIDDLRESPALLICNELSKKSETFELCVFEPHLSAKQIQMLGFTCFEDIISGIDWADIILILVKHRYFTVIKHIDLQEKVIVDTCGLLYEQGVGLVETVIIDKERRNETSFFSKG
jgi:UDP-N-acetyl-D-mannosaminuronic acid dehydrogenase